MKTKRSGSKGALLNGLLMVMLLTLVGCASTPSPSTIPSLPPGVDAAPTNGGGVIGFLGGVADSALSAVGLKKPDVPELPKVPDSALPDLKVNWRIYASESLNVDEQGHALALVLRIYKLKSPDAFLQAPYDTFGDGTKERAALGDDLVAAREVQLVPGQHYEAVDKVAREARYIGIVALYRNPLPGRWRYAFSAAQADKTGLHVGAHACAMSVQVGEAIGQSANAVRSVAAPCP